MHQSQAHHGSLVETSNALLWALSFSRILSLPWLRASKAALITTVMTGRVGNQYKYQDLNRYSSEGMIKQILQKDNL